MKTFHSLPNDNDFFNRYATLTPTLYKLGFFAQLVSAFTEFGIIYSLIFSSLADFWPGAAALIAYIGAFIGTAFLEVGLRKFAPYSVRAVLHGRFFGLDLLMTIFILLATCALLATSGALSFKGSKNLVEAVAPAPEQRTTGAADTAYQTGRVIALQAYRADSAEVAARYASQAAAIQAAYKSQIGAKKTERSNLSTRERATGQSYATAKADLKTQIAALEAERDSKIAALELDKGRELSDAAKGRKTALESANKEYSAAKDSVLTFNAVSASRIERKVNTYGGGLAWFTVICLFVFTISVILHEAHRKGSGIEEKVIPSQYDFSAPILSEFLGATGNKAQQWLRARIRRIEEGTPPPPLPLAPNELYSLENLQLPVFRLNFDEIPEAYKDVRIEARPAPTAKPTRWPKVESRAGGADPEKTDGSPALLYLEASRKFKTMGHPDLAREQELKADQVLKMYLGPNATPSAVADLKAACLAFLDGAGANPFDHHHRRPIGFTGPATATRQEPHNGDRLTVNVEGKKTKVCERCGTPFVKKHWNAKYCSDACRIASWETRTGKTFGKGKPSPDHPEPVKRPERPAEPKFVGDIMALVESRDFEGAVKRMNQTAVSSKSIREDLKPWKEAREEYEKHRAKSKNSMRLDLLEATSAAADKLEKIEKRIIGKIDAAVKARLDNLEAYHGKKN